MTTPNPKKDVYSTPVWVKRLGLGVGLVVLAAALVMATGLGGGHGPWRHAPVGEGTPVR